MVESIAVAESIADRLTGEHAAAFGPHAGGLALDAVRQRLRFAAVKPGAKLAPAPTDRGVIIQLP